MPPGHHPYECISNSSILLPSTEKQTHLDYHQDCKQVRVVNKPSWWGRDWLKLLVRPIWHLSSPFHKASLVLFHNGLWRSLPSSSCRLSERKWFLFTWTSACTHIRSMKPVMQQWACAVCSVTAIHVYWCSLQPANWVTSIFHILATLVEDGEPWHGTQVY